MFDQWILRGYDWYWEKGIAYIEKTPDMHPIKVYGDRRRGQFIAIYTKQAQPDFKGTLCNGSTVIFDTKSTRDDWKTDPESLGCKHFKRDDLEPYRIQCRNGVILFLEGIK